MEHWSQRPRQRAQKPVAVPSRVWLAEPAVRYSASGSRGREDVWVVSLTEGHRPTSRRLTAKDRGKRRVPIAEAVVNGFGEQDSGEDFGDASDLKAGIRIAAVNDRSTSLWLTQPAATATPGWLATYFCRIEASDINDRRRLAAVHWLRDVRMESVVFLCVALMSIDVRQPILEPQGRWKLVVRNLGIPKLSGEAYLVILQPRNRDRPITVPKVHGRTKSRTRFPGWMFSSALKCPALSPGQRLSVGVQLRLRDHLLYELRAHHALTGDCRDGSKWARLQARPERTISNT